MGLSRPGQVLAVEPGGVGVVDVHGDPHRVRLALVTASGAQVREGDWLLVQLGLAVARLDAVEAADLMRLLNDRPFAG